jgi:hypothetical protein
MPERLFCLLLKVLPFPAYLSDDANDDEENNAYPNIDVPQLIVGQGNKFHAHDYHTESISADIQHKE